MRTDRIVAAAFVVLVSTAIVGLSTGESGASFTGTTTNPGQILQTSTVAAPASETAASAIAGRVDLSWPATTTPANGHTVTYLVLRNGVQVGTTAALVYSDTPASDGTYTYTVQTKIAQGAGFFTSGNSPAQNGVSDRTAPTASITCAGAACGAGWYTTLPSVVITGADGGSGISTVSRNVDGGGNVAGASPMTIPALGQGTHTVAYFATDVAGNSNGATTQTIKVDTLPPTAATGLTSVKGVATGSIDLTWSAGTDGGSGVSGYTIHRTGALGAGGCPVANTGNYPNTSTVGVVTATTIAGLATGSKYCFYLTTTDNVAWVSANSAAAGPQPAK
jgi:hypothetical protein